MPARLLPAIRCLLPAIACLVVGACGGPVSPSPSADRTPSATVGPPVSVVPSGPVTVTLGIYSGRPDPEWTLTADQAAGLTTILASLPTSMATPPVGGLGYHGFTIKLPGRTLVAYRGIVAPPGDGPRATTVDPTRSVERFLLETARPHLTSVESSEVERALAGS